MAKAAAHKWAFKPGMRAGAYSWRSSSKAIERLKSASSEIRAVARVDPVTAAEGVIALAQRIWPAFEHIDTSSGALGNAVRRTLEELLPVLIDTPADEKTRAKWLEQLREAIEDDGLDYLAPIADRFGKIAAYPALMSLHADRDLEMIEAAWSDHMHFIHVPMGTLTLSCLLEAGRYDELLALLERKKTRYRVWHCTQVLNHYFTVGFPGVRPYFVTMVRNDPVLTGCASVDLIFGHYRVLTPAKGSSANHSFSFDHLWRPATFFTAMAIWIRKLPMQEP